MRTRFLLLALVFLLLQVPLISGEIIFSGGATRIRMQQGFETITLSNGARVQSDSIILEAREITLSGSDYRYVRCTGNVRLHDEKRGISLSTQNLFYDRQKDIVLINGYVELEDTTNEVLASAFSMEFDLAQSLVLLQVQVKLLKNTDRGTMECKADSLSFDRERQILTLEGSAEIDWARDFYEAEYITVDLNTEEISMGGSIKGVIYG
ncbi:MAG: hypothetical protein EOM15_07140 [Spirochaetia bacterium]|nr:hypothetical protein [Spirochaetia bacterium]